METEALALALDDTRSEGSGWIVLDGLGVDISLLMQNTSLSLFVFAVVERQEEPGWKEETLSSDHKTAAFASKPD